MNGGGCGFVFCGVGSAYSVKEFGGGEGVVVGGSVGNKSAQNEACGYTLVLPLSHVTGLISLLN